MEKIVLVVLAAVILGASAGHVQDQAQYTFEYGVHDPQTNDIKSQHEERIGHHVTGSYSLKEADGTTRVVKYRSGPYTGFEAVVERIGQAHHPSQYARGHGYGQGFGGATSHVGGTHWSNQGPEGHGH